MDTALLGSGFVVRLNLLGDFALGLLEILAGWAWTTLPSGFDRPRVDVGRVGAKPSYSRACGCLSACTQLGSIGSDSMSNIWPICAAASQWTA